MKKSNADKMLIFDSNKFWENLDSYRDFKKKNDNFFSIIKNGLSVLFQNQYFKSVSIYLLNDDSLVFESKSTIPVSESIHIDSLYSELVDKDIIANVLESQQLVIYNNVIDARDEYVIINPLFSAKEIPGLMICILNCVPVDLPKDFISMYKLLCDIFSNDLENYSLHVRLNKSQSLLEQKVAVRTLSLIQSKRELQSILNSVQTGIIVIDTDTNRISNANLVASQLIEELQEKIVGNYASQYFETADILNQLFDDKLAFSRNFESYLIKVSGETIPILRSVSNINIGDQKLRIESFTDISERKKHEISLKKANELLEQKVQDRTEDLQILVHKLKKEVEERKKAEREILKMLEREKELNELKSRFVSMVSHEFRTPLTVISSAAQIVERYREKLSEDEINQYLGRILKTVDLMSTLLENVIFIGRSDVHKVNYNPNPLNLQEFSRSLIQDMELSLNKKRVIIFNCNCDGLEFNVDEKLLHQILLNLLSNALKYSNEPNPVEFNLKADNDEAIFSIKDYGIGIPEDELENIFEQFFRAKNVGAISGTGLGMSVIMRSLDIMSGKIDIESRINEGSTFSITIPNHLKS